MLYFRQLISYNGIFNVIRRVPDSFSRQMTTLLFNDNSLLEAIGSLGCRHISSSQCEWFHVRDQDEKRKSGKGQMVKMHIVFQCHYACVHIWPVHHLTLIWLLTMSCPFVHKASLFAILTPCTVTIDGDLCSAI